MTSAKAIQIGKDIDVARCNGRWDAIPELARRYKKYNSDGGVLEQTVLAEANLNKLINDTRSKTSVDYGGDAPHRVSMEDRLNPKQLKSIQDQLQTAIELSDPNNLHSIEKDFARIVLARTYFECGEYEQAVNIISQLSFEMEHVKQGYGLVLFLQARVIKAISFELTGNEEAAIQSYAGVESLLSDNPTAKSKTFVEWSEEALYRATLLGLREPYDSSIPSSAVLEFMRQYQKMTTIQPTLWRIQKRMTITRYSLKFVSSLYRQGHYSIPAGTVIPEGEDDEQLERQIFIVEQSQLHTIYEKMLYLQVPLPRAGEVNTRVLDFVDQFANDFELIGTTAHDLRGFVEALDRASQRTFNSPLITRHLFLALVRLGEYEEAEQALHAYLYLVGLVSYGWKESHGDGQALATDKNGFNMPVPKSRPEIEENQMDHDLEPPYLSLKREISGISDIKNSEKEDVSDTLNVIVTAIKMYCNDLGRGVDAVEMAEIAKELYQKQPRSERETILEMGAVVYRATGIAYGSLGCQTFDPELRPTYHEKALNFLKRSIELNPNAWETYYQLALQQADMHDIGQAVHSVTKAIQAQPTNLPSWHLLTLIISCPVHGDYRQALKTCEMGLQQAMEGGCPDIMEDSNGSGYDEAEQHMLFQMTRVLLLHALYGPEDALEFSKTLFGSFGKIAVPDAYSYSANSLENLSYGGAHNGMVVSGSLGNLSEMQLSAERRRGRSASNSMISHHPTVSSSTELGSPLGSRSHDNVNVTASKSSTIGRARSASNLAANPSPLGPGYNQAMQAGMLNVPDDAKAHHHHHHHHLHGLHLFSSKSTSNRTKAIENNAALIGNNNNSIASLNNVPYDLKSLAGNSVASFQSLSPSIASIQSILQPSVIPTKPSTRTVLRKQRSDRILSDLWLLTAQMFIKLGKLDEARKAVEEAENVDWISNPRVWCVLGQLLEAEGDFEQAQTAYYKSLVVDPNDVICRLWLAKSHMTQNNQEIAEGILEILTKSNGWDCAEAWFYLGEIYRQTDRLDRTKACLFYALELESTTPIQPFSVLPRYI